MQAASQYLWTFWTWVQLPLFFLFFFYVTRVVHDLTWKDRVMEDWPTIASRPLNQRGMILPEEKLHWGVHVFAAAVLIGMLTMLFLAHDQQSEDEKSLYKGVLFMLVFFSGLAPAVMYSTYATRKIKDKRNAFAFLEPRQLLAILALALLGMAFMAVVLEK